MVGQPGDNPSLPSAQQARDQRRAAARDRIRRQRRRLAIGGAAAVVLLVAVVSLVAGGGSSGKHGNGGSKRSLRRTPPTPVDGGPLAPLSVGGLAALWAPQNVVGAQPGTAAAYAAASKIPGPGGCLLIADRGNNRILVVNPKRGIVFRFPSPADLAAGRKLFYNDDTFVEPGGLQLIGNEEDD